MESKHSHINPFVFNAPFLYLLKTPENLQKTLRISEGFLMFVGGRERVHWKQMGYKNKVFSMKAFFFQVWCGLIMSDMCTTVFRFYPTLVLFVQRLSTWLLIIAWFSVPENFAKFTGKHLFWSLFLINLQNWGPITY